MSEQRDVAAAENAYDEHSKTGQEAPNDEENIPDAPSTAAIKVTETQLDPERLLSAFGKYGKYQMRSYLLITAPGLLFSSQMLIMGFIAQAPPFECLLNITNLTARSVSLIIFETLNYHTMIVLCLFE
ncbi:unnamed protein product [Gongylonema pulchrum]|uniref:Solute carrier family 40 protein n=1 Tax=Gongylonema pulchrum TaxID=637853 RepID=A0A183D103_9BILA|nr:unnamed protein product [Gongylonema pulchrum]